MAVFYLCPFVPTLNRSSHYPVPSLRSVPALTLISDESKKADMLKVDDALDEVSGAPPIHVQCAVPGGGTDASLADIVGDLARIAAAQSEELDRSKEQLERVNKRTDEALTRAQKQNAAIKREIRDN